MAASSGEAERPGDGMRRLLDAPKIALDKAPVLQAVFSDGLTHVSLFIEPYDAKLAVTPVTGQLGATGTLRQRRGEHWVTVMGDVPAATLKAFADALERRR